MDYMNNKKIFISFLKENNCFSLFIYNFYKGKDFREKFGYPIKIEKYFREIDPYSYVEDSFLWTDTPQGRSFWAKVSHKWISVFNEKWKDGDRFDGFLKKN